MGQRHRIQAAQAPPDQADLAPAGAILRLDSLGNQVLGAAAMGQECIQAGGANLACIATQAPGYGLIATAVEEFAQA